MASIGALFVLSIMTAGFAVWNTRKPNEQGATPKAFDQKPKPGSIADKLDHYEQGFNVSDLRDQIKPAPQFGPGDDAAFKDEARREDDEAERARERESDRRKQERRDSDIQDRLDQQQLQIDDDEAELAHLHNHQ